jgi:hypothetical protein
MPARGIVHRHDTNTSGKLLLNEECSQMRQLPCAGNTKNNELNHSPTDDARVRVFGLVAELGFTLLLVVSNAHRTLGVPQPKYV